MPENLLTEWSRLLLASLMAAGVQHVVVSPGSRSTPLVAALLGTPGLQVHVLVDERSAAFFGLGLAKMSGIPALLVCTSGTALAHYYPALIEAHECNTPLLVLSADRPSALQANRAPQTIDQTQLYGNKVRAFFDLGAPDASTVALLGLQRKAHQAVALCLGPVPGPVHLNFPAGKPLEPVTAQTADERALTQSVSQVLAQGGTLHFAPQLVPSAAAVTQLLQRAAQARCPAVSFGPCAPAERSGMQQALQCALSAGWPVFAESTSQARWGSVSTGHPELEPVFVDHFEQLLRAGWSEQERPDFVLHFGGPLTSGAWSRWLSSANAPQLAVVAPYGWPVPENRAALILASSPACVAQALSAADGQSRLPAASPAWRARARRAQGTAAACIAHSVQALAASSKFAEPTLYRALQRSMGAEDLLVLGNSLPVRLADSLLPHSAQDIVCLSQRGANGIDGLISLTAGASQLHTGFTCLVLGDISALHDAGSLQLLPHVARPLCVVVVNNQGGRIFEQLPSAALPDSAPWVTPHTFDLWRIAAAYGVRAVCAESETELQHALAAARQHAGATVIEAKVDPSSAHAWQQQLSAELRAQLATRAEAE